MNVFTFKDKGDVHGEGAFAAAAASQELLHRPYEAQDGALKEFIHLFICFFINLLIN